ncbi:glycosyl hydrolase [Treponema sp.]|uniref:glycosyl hydrolase n=1 Tax=Treponema sp. TaxID=166 RepID=UPI003F0AC574
MCMIQTANKNAIPEAKALLSYFAEISGKKIITGQHTQTVPMEEISYIKSVTGKEPKLRGFELLSYSPNINYSDSDIECLTEVEENRNTAEIALKWAKENSGILTFTFHWFSPLGGHGKSFYAENTDFDASRIFQEGTEERSCFFRDMDVIAELLKKFEGIPILWRPFHECYGDWFWWGAKGPVVASRLYSLMFDYYTNFHKLDNLLWVWNCNVKEAYPGDDKVDVVSIDVYRQQYEPTDYSREYRSLCEGSSKNKVCALAEVGYIPDVSLLEQTHIPWAYYMTWSKEFCIGEKYNSKSSLLKMYESRYAVTL